jgi:hypothetical protein
MSFSLRSSFRAALCSRCFNSGPSRIVIACVLIRLQISYGGLAARVLKKAWEHLKSFERQEKSFKKCNKMLPSVNRNDYMRLYSVRNEAKSETPTLTFPPDLHRKLEKIAPKTNLSMADVIRLCLALPANCQNSYQSSGSNKFQSAEIKRLKRLRPITVWRQRIRTKPGSPPAEKLSPCPP